jgi:glycerol-3-phosphate dehydrogenase
MNGDAIDGPGPWDAIIVGAGIQGATLADELAKRGRRVLVVERAHPGAANTSASFGLLHGGLRYLQQFDVRRWLRSRREQAWFMREMPDLVRPLACEMPLYRGALRSPALFRAAFAAERIAVRHARGAGATPAGHLIAADEVAPGFPLPRHGLIGAARWHELLLPEPRAAVQRLLDSARRSSGSSVMHGSAAALLSHRGTVTGLAVETPTGRVEVRAPLVLLCAGAATRSLARRFDRDRPCLSSATLAFNLLLDLAPPPDRGLAVSATPGRGRSLFLRAQGNRLLAGTWYAPWPEHHESGTHPDGTPTVPPALIESALNELRACLPDLAVDASCLRGAPAGVLPDVDGTGTALRHRDVLVRHEDDGGPRGLWSVLGVKLTTARALSERAARAVWPHDDVPGRRPAAHRSGASVAPGGAARWRAGG